MSWQQDNINNIVKTNTFLRSSDIDYLVCVIAFFLRQICSQ